MSHARTGIPPLLAALFLAAPAPAQQPAEWPQWRGPDRDGISKETGLDVKGQGELWLTNVGTGYSTVSIVDGRLYTTGHDPEKQEDTVFCIDPETGLDVWTYGFKCGTHAMMHGGGSLTTPSVGGGRVYASNREGKLFCLDAKKGSLLWSKDLAEEHGLRMPRWGFAASPLILDDMIVMNVGHVIAFSRDGKLLWKTSRNYGDCYSTPADVELDGRACLAVFNARGLLIVDRKTGEELTFHRWATRSNVNAATPVAIGNKIFISSGYNRGGAMLQATPENLEVLWESRVMRTQLAGCVHFKGHLYGFDESTLKCLDLDGNVKWEQRGLGKGAFVIADGKLVIMSSRGDLVIAEARPDEFRELSRRNVLGGGVYWTTPVVCGGRIYCRNSMGDLVCMDHRPPTKKPSRK